MKIRNLIALLGTSFVLMCSPPKKDVAYFCDANGDGRTDISIPSKSLVLINLGDGKYDSTQIVSSDGCPFYKGKEWTYSPWGLALSNINPYVYKHMEDTTFSFLRCGFPDFRWMSEINPLEIHITAPDTSK